VTRLRRRRDTSVLKVARTHAHTHTHTHTHTQAPPLLLPTAPPKPPTPRNDRAGERLSNPSPCTAAAMAATLHSSLLKRDRALRASLDDGQRRGEAVEGLPLVRLRPNREWGLAAVHAALARERVSRAAESGGGSGGSGSSGSDGGGGSPQRGRGVSTFPRTLARFAFPPMQFMDPQRIGTAGDVGASMGPDSPRKFESQPITERW
jgi:hypothetical protein